MSVVSFSSPATVRQVLDYLKDNSSVQHLTCRGVLDDDSIQTFHDAVASNQQLLASLHTLNLPANNFSSCSLPVIARILQQLSASGQLQHVDLSENHLGDACNNNGLELLVDVFTSSSSNDDYACSIHSLNLQHNKIGPKGSHALSRLLRHNTSLHSLVLAHNALGTKTIKAIATSLAQNSTLSHLDLSYNKLSDRGIYIVAAAIFDETSASRLAYLDVQYNKIGPSGAYALARALLDHGNKYLTCLNLSLNCIGAEGAHALGAVLKYSHILERLYLGRNDMGQGVLPLLQGLADSQVTRLKLLDLSWNSLTDDAAAFLAEHVLPKTNYLETLNLASNAIGDRGMMALAKALVSNLSLRELDIVGNQARDKSAFALAEVLTSPHCDLRMLKWEKNNFSQAGKMRLQAAIAYIDSLEKWLDKYLKEIRTRKVIAVDFSSRRIGDNELIAICRALAKHKPRVPILWLYGDAKPGKHASSDGDDDCSVVQLITSRGITVLARDVLAKNAGRIERVYVDKCIQIGNDGWSALAEALATNKTVVILSLTRSDVSMDAVKCLGTALQRNTTLERLNLSENKLGDAVITKVADLIRAKERKYVLKSINLSRNEISDSGLNGMPSLGDDCVLEELHLAGNDISDAGALDLAKACIHNNSLKWVNLSQNRLSYRGKRALKLFLPIDAVLETDEQRQ